MTNESGGEPSDFSRIDRLCDRFEGALQAGEWPDVQEYLAEVPESTRASLLFELVHLQCSYAPGNTSAILDQCFARFPQYASALESLDGAPERQAGSEKVSCGVSLGDSEHQLLMARAAALAKTWPLSELPREAVWALAEAMEEETYEAGEILVRQGEPSAHLLVLLEGDTEVRVLDREDTRTSFPAQAPCILGEMGVLSGEACTATIVAQTTVRALTLPADDLRRLAARHPVLMPAIGRLMADRLGQHEFDALAGKTLGKYRVEHGVGRGGMATVYLATEISSGRQVALKMMSHRFVGDSHALSRFEREFDICRGLSHPHIAGVFEHFTAFGTHFIVMEFCPGETLHHWIKRCGPLPLDVVRKIAGQLAQALAYAHGLGVVHRDVKPSNIMIREDGLLKLMDFGLAKSKSSFNPDLTTHGQILGTIRYMPPEQVQGEAIDYRVDLFAFGCIVYEMITGKPFLQGESILDILGAHLQMALPPQASIREGLDAELHAVLRETLTRSPADRILDLASIGDWAGNVDVDRLEASAKSREAPAGSDEPTVSQDRTVEEPES